MDVSKEIRNLSFDNSFWGRQIVNTNQMQNSLREIQVTVTTSTGILGADITAALQCTMYSANIQREHRGTRWLVHLLKKKKKNHTTHCVCCLTNHKMIMSSDTGSLRLSCHSTDLLIKHCLKNTIFNNSLIHRVKQIPLHKV